MANRFSTGGGASRPKNAIWPSGQQGGTDGRPVSQFCCGATTRQVSAVLAQRCALRDKDRNKLGRRAAEA